MVLEVAARRLVQRPLHLGVEDHAPGRRDDPLAAPRVLDRILEVDRARIDRELDVLLRPEPPQTLDADRLRGLLGRELLQVVLAVREEVRA